KTQSLKLKIALVSLRTAYTLALLLIIFDTTITLAHQERSRLLITTSDLPLMRLPNQSGGTQPSQTAEAFSRRLSNDASLTKRFTINRTIGASLTKAALVGDEIPVSAIIYLADQSDAAILEAERLSRFTAAPLFIVTVSSDRELPDVSVSSVDCAGSALLDVPQTITATLYGRGMSGRSTLVKLSDEAVVIASTMIAWKDSSESITASLQVAPRVEGLHRYTVKAEPVEGELNTENNEASFSLDVRRGERKILFIENQPTWEGKFIRRALEENASITVDYFAEVSRDAVLNQQQSGIERNMHSILKDFKQLARYDCVIAGPMDAAMVSEREAQNINQFVERRGGGFVILGGNDFNGSILSASSRLANLCPAIVSINSNSQQESVAPSSVETAVARQTVLAPTGGGESLFWSYANNISISNLGPLSDSYLRVKSLKPGAAALAIDRAEKQTLIAAQPYGYGRALLFAPADSWRIQLAESGENKGHFAALWQNIAFWAAGNAEAATNIRLQTSAIEAGTEMRAYVTARDDSFNPLMSLSIKAALDFDAQAEKGTKLPVTISHTPATPGVYELTAPVSSEGNGNLSVELESKDAGARSVNIAFSAHKKKSEWREPLDASDRLAQVAQATGGELFAIEHLESLKLKLLELQPANRESRVTHYARNSIALAFLLPLLMAAEYFLRRRYVSD
ncbi:MAG TPA: hypothetical protein VJX74_16730, partial [Blastocatellia bacterium]|nr:hypothetical protein [Blastocatellia bacterium]